MPETVCFERVSVVPYWDSSLEYISRQFGSGDYFQTIFSTHPQLGLEFSYLFQQLGAAGDDFEHFTLVPNWNLSFGFLYRQLGAGDYCECFFHSSPTGT